MKFRFDNNLVFWGQRLVILFLPLFFLPFSPLQLGADNYSKSLFLGFGVLSLLLLDIYLQIKQGQLKYRYNNISIPLLFLLFLFFVSSLFSVSRFNSFFGSLDYFSFNFFALLFLFLFFALLYDYASTENRANKIISTVVLGGIAVSLISFFALFFRDIFVNTDIVKNMFGNSEDLALYFVALLLLFMSIASIKDLALRFFKKLAFYNTLVLVIFLLIFRLDFVVAWWVLGIGSLLLVYIRWIVYRNNELKFKNFVGPILLVLLSVNFLLNFYLLDGASQLKSKMAQYRQLDLVSSVSIGLETLKHNPLLGLGLENFSYAYSKYRTKDMNEMRYWDVRYAKPGSFVTAYVLAGGALATIMLVYLLFKLGRISFLLLGIFKKEELSEAQKAEKSMALLFIVPIFAVIFGLFFYTATFNLLFLLLVMIVLFLAFIKLHFFEYRNLEITSEEGAWCLDIEGDKKKRLSVFLIFSALLIFLIVYFSYAFKFALADASYVKSVRGEYEKLRAVNLSPLRYQYNLDVSKMYRDRSLASLKNRRMEESLAFQKKAIEFARKAQLVGEWSVSAQEGAAKVFRDFSQGNDGNHVLVQAALRSAVELEPTNPALLSEYAKALYVSGEFVEAENYYEKAKSVKADYLPAELGLARVMVAQGNAEKAIPLLEDLSVELMDAGVYYELGMAYYNTGNYEKARTYFSNTLTLSPLHANAMYGIALTLEKLGEDDKALYYLQKLDSLNPGNEEIEGMIEELES